MKGPCSLVGSRRRNLKTSWADCKPRAQPLQGRLGRLVQHSAGRKSHYMHPVPSIPSADNIAFLTGVTGLWRYFYCPHRWSKSFLTEEAKVPGERAAAPCIPESPVTAHICPLPSPQPMAKSKINREEPDSPLGSNPSLASAGLWLDFFAGLCFGFLVSPPLRSVGKVNSGSQQGSSQIFWFCFLSFQPHDKMVLPLLTCFPTKYMVWPHDLVC